MKEKKLLYLKELKKAIEKGRQEIHTQMVNTKEGIQLQKWTQIL